MPGAPGHPRRIRLYNKAVLVLDKLDLAIIALYLAGIHVIRAALRKKQRTLRDYFLADRNIPWWAIALSIVAAETSTLTIISIPRTGLRYESHVSPSGDGICRGALRHQFCSAAALLPWRPYTAYELIERRFGRRLAFPHRGLPGDAGGSEGVRYAVSIVVAIASAQARWRPSQSSPRCLSSTRLRAGWRR